MPSARLLSSPDVVGYDDTTGRLYNQQGATDLIGDATGYFAPA